MQKKRIDYIDIMKGMLIVCLYYGHSIVYGGVMSIDYAASHIIGKTVPFYESFFMQTFFIITGFCSSFSQGFKIFFLKNVKTILLPGLLMCFLSYLPDTLSSHTLLEFLTLNTTNLFYYFSVKGEWFILAIFYGKMLFWLLHKIHKDNLIIVFAIYLIGLFLNESDLVVNYSYHRHALLSLPFLYIGFKIKGIDFDKYPQKIVIISLVGGIILLIQLICTLKGVFHIPFQDHGVYVTFLNWPLHFLNVICGSIIIFTIARKIGKNHFLSNLGYGSLLAYLMNGFMLKSFMYMLIQLGFIPHNQLVGFFFYLIVITLSLLSINFMIRLIYNSPRLSWIVGKW